MVSADGAAVNPLLWPKFPAIDYSFTFCVAQDGDGQWSVCYCGRHDGFPAYEIYVRIGDGPWTPVHQYNPNDHCETPWSLFGDGEWMYQWTKPIPIPSGDDDDGSDDDDDSE